jgi:hypothetical protein
MEILNFQRRFTPVVSRQKYKNVNAFICIWKIKDGQKISVKLNSLCCSLNLLKSGQP